MNWFTKENVSGLSLEKKQALSIDNPCEHVEKDISLLTWVVKENDSFGSEATGLCKACFDEMKEAEQNEQVCCQDCKGTVLKKDSIEWRWYDFYAAQGDTPIVVCTVCQKEDKHALRVKNDQRDYEAEFGFSDDEFDTDY